MTRRILCLDISLHERIFKFFSCRFIFLEIVLNALFLTQFHLIFSSSRSTYFFFFFGHALYCLLVLSSMRATGRVVRGIRTIDMSVRKRGPGNRPRTLGAVTSYVLLSTWRLSLPDSVEREAGTTGTY